MVPEFFRLRVVYTHLKAVGQAIDPLTGLDGPELRLARRPADEGRIGFVFTPLAGLTVEPSIVFVGKRFSGFGEIDRLPSYARIDAYAEYKLNDTFSLYGRAQNLTDTQYEEVKNYGTAGRSFYAGLRATW
jgi:vitamin B12 transporter